MAELFAAFLVCAVIGVLVLPLLLLVVTIKLFLKAVLLPAVVLIGLFKLMALLIVVPLVLALIGPLLVAIAIFAIPLVIVGGLFFGAMHLLL